MCNNMSKMQVLYVTESSPCNLTTKLGVPGWLFSCGLSVLCWTLQSCLHFVAVYYHMVKLSKICNNWMCGLFFCFFVDKTIWINMICLQLLKRETIIAGGGDCGSVEPSLIQCCLPPEVWGVGSRTGREKTSWGWFKLLVEIDHCLQETPVASL